MRIVGCVAFVWLGLASAILAPDRARDADVEFAVHAHMHRLGAIGDRRDLRCVPQGGPRYVCEMDFTVHARDAAVPPPSHHWVRLSVPAAQRSLPYAIEQHPITPIAG